MNSTQCLPDLWYLRGKFAVSGRRASAWGSRGQTRRARGDALDDGALLPLAVIQQTAHAAPDQRLVRPRRLPTHVQLRSARARQQEATATSLDTPAAGARDARRHLELVDVREYESALVAHKPVLRVSSPLLRQRRVPKALEMHRVGHMRAAQPVSARDLRVGARCYVWPARVSWSVSRAAVTARARAPWSRRGTAARTTPPRLTHPYLLGGAP